MKKQIAVGFILGLLIAGCGAQEIKTTVPFNKSEAAYILKQGRATVSGQAFLKRRDGVVVTCAGAEVNLIPVSEYAKQRFTALYGSENGGYRRAFGGNSTGEIDQDYINYTRQSTCDAEGDFEFKGVANGDYYVTTKVLWQISDYYYEGGALSKRILVENGRSQNVILAN